MWENDRAQYAAEMITCAVFISCRILRQIKTIYEGEFLFFIFHLVVYYINIKAIYQQLSITHVQFNLDKQFRLWLMKRLTIFQWGQWNEKEPDEFQQHEEEKNPRLSCHNVQPGRKISPQSQTS